MLIHSIPVLIPVPPRCSSCSTLRARSSLGDIQLGFVTGRTVHNMEELPHHWLNCAQHGGTASSLAELGGAPPRVTHVCMSCSLQVFACAHISPYYCINIEVVASGTWSQVKTKWYQLQSYEKTDPARAVGGKFLHRIYWYHQPACQGVAKFLELTFSCIHMQI